MNNPTKDQYFLNRNNQIITRSKWILSDETSYSDEDMECNEFINVDELIENDIDAHVKDCEINENLEFMGGGQDETPTIEPNTLEDHDVSDWPNSKKTEVIPTFQPNFEQGQYFNTDISRYKYNENQTTYDDDSSHSEDECIDENISTNKTSMHATEDNDQYQYWKRAMKIEMIGNESDYDEEIAEQAILNEVLNMQRNNVWFNMPKHVNTKYIPSKLFVKVKRNDSGAITKVKARMTAGGHMQKDVDEVNSFSPKSSIHTIMMMCTTHCKRNSKFSVMDIGAAYLKANIQDEIYMKVDLDIVKYMKQVNMVNEEHIREDGSVIVKLIKALYGTKQAGRAWFEKLNEDIKSIGYKSNDVELGVYSKSYNGKISTIIVFVDDIILMCEDKAEHDRVIGAFEKFYKDVTVSTRYETKFEYLGLNFNVKDKALHVNMSGYINKLLEVQKNYKRAETPYTIQLIIQQPKY